MKDIVVKTERLMIHVASQEEMEQFIKSQTVDILKLAYTEMLNGCLNNPDQWEWYAIWMIELKDGTHIGELCFKGLDSNGIAEIGYGISEKYRNNGYAYSVLPSLLSAQWIIFSVSFFHLKTSTPPKTELERKLRSYKIISEKLSA